MRNLEFLFVPYCAIECKKRQTCNQNNSSCSINALERRNESLPQARITKDTRVAQAREGGAAGRQLNPGTRACFRRLKLAGSSWGHRLWRAWLLCYFTKACSEVSGGEQGFTVIRSPRFGGGRISQRCVLRVSKVAKYSPKAFPDTHPWQDFRLMYDKRGLGRKNTPSVATYRRYVSKMSWSWQDLGAACPKSPANRCLGIHIVKILPGRTPFSVQDL